MNIRKKILLSLSSITVVGGVSTGIFFISNSAKPLPKGGNEYVNTSNEQKNPIEIDDTKIDKTPIFIDKTISNNKVDIKFNSSNPIKYLALGDSITEGYTGELDKIIKGSYDFNTKKVTGNGYPSHFVNYILEADPSLISDFSNYAISGSTAQEWYSLLSLNDNSDYINENIKANKLTKEDLYPLFGKDLDNLSNEIISKIKISNLITLSVGANDFIKCFISEFSKKIDLPFILKNIKDKDELLKYFINSVSEVFDTVDTIVKRNLYSLSKAILHYNQNAQIIFLKYPMPMLRIKNAIDSIIKIAKPDGSNEAPIELSKVLLDTINARISNIVIDSNNLDQVKIINLYDNDYWELHRNIISPVILDIHPGNKGYKKMAQDLFISLATNFNNLKEIKDEIKFFASPKYFENLRKIPKLIDFGLDDKNLLEKVFNSNLEKDLIEFSELENSYKDLISNKNNSKKIAEYVEFYFFYSSDGYNYFARNVQDIIKGILDSNIVKNIDPDGKIKSYLFDNNNENLNSISKQFLDSKIIPKLFSEFQDYSDTLDLDKNNIPGVQEFNLNILKEVIEKSFGNKNTWFEFLKVMFNGTYITKTENKQKLNEILQIVIDNSFNLLSKSNLISLVKKIELSTSITNLIDKNDFYYLIEKIIFDNSFKNLITNILKKSVKSIDQIFNDSNDFNELFKKLISLNKTNILSDFKNIIFSLLNDERSMIIISNLVLRSFDEFQDFIPYEILNKWIPKLGNIIRSVNNELKIIDIFMDYTYDYIVEYGFDFTKFGKEIEKLKGNINLDQNKIVKLLINIIKNNEDFFDTNINELIKDVVEIVKKDKVKNEISKLTIDFLKKQNIIKSNEDYVLLIKDSIELLLNNDLNLVNSIITEIYNEIKINKINENSNLNDILKIVFLVIGEKFNKNNFDTTIQTILNSHLLTNNSNLLKTFIKEVCANFSSIQLLEKIYIKLNKTNKLESYILQDDFVKLSRDILVSNQFSQIIDFIFNSLDCFKNKTYKEGINDILILKKDELKSIINSVVNLLMNNQTFKNTLINVLKVELLKISNDDEYKKSIEKILNEVKISANNIVNELKVNELVTELILDLINNKLNGAPLNTLKIFKLIYNKTSFDEMFIEILRKVCKTNILQNNKNEIKIITRTIFSSLLSNKQKIKNIIKSIDSNIREKINNFIDFDFVLDTISNKYKDDFLLLVDIFVNGFLESIPQVENITNLSSLFNTIFKNINEDEFKKLVVKTIDKIISDEEILTSIAIRMKDLLVGKNLLDNNEQMVNGIKSIIRLIPELNKKGKYLDKVIDLVVLTLKENQDINNYQKELITKIKSTKFIDINNLKDITSILKETKFINERDSIKAVIKSIFDHLWADENVAKNTINTINFPKILNISNLISDQDLNKFIFEYIYKPTSNDSFKCFITNIFNDLFNRPNVYGDKNKLMDIIKEFILNPDYESQNKLFIKKLISDVIEHTNILPNLIFEKLKGLEINFIDDDLVVVTSVVKSMFNAMKDTNFFGDIINNFYDNLKNYSYTNDISKDFKGVVDKVVAHLIKDNNNKIDINKIVNNIIPELSKIINNSQLDASLYTKFINLLFIRSEFNEEKSKGIYKIINDLINMKGASSEVTYNVFDLLTKAPDNLRKLITSIIKPIAKAHIDESINDKKPTNFDIYEDENFHAVNRIATVLAWFLKKNVPNIAFWSVNASYEMSTIIFTGIENAFNEVLSSFNGISNDTKKKYFLSGYDFAYKIFHSRRITIREWNYTKEDWLAYIYYYDKKDRNHPGKMNSDNLWYLLKNGHLMR
ncbi:SGNH/GDSL hydrolase family protein [Mycoplasma elephantis]|uniref:SGNH/GDSL hydrolase family protein n=1 Tax=Mycoplasma elephantis TaxID=114882 RepID=UPI000487AD08|nr:SGNH/GDSL hydrolase family protein [Mycoplasma elephantis]